MAADSRHKWYLLDMIMFILINALLLRQLGPEIAALTPLKPYYLILFGLAVYRAANIISNETVTKPLRQPFITTFKRYGKEQEKPRERGFRGAVGAFITCPSCTGVWLATFIIYSYLLAPGATTVIVIILALSAFERLIARFLEFFKEKPHYN